MEKIICLDTRYSTTRIVSKEKLSIINDPNSKVQTMLLLPEVAGRKGVGGLRTKGYFKKSIIDKPLTTVITVVFNGERHLEKTIQSVISQTYDNIEYIIVDGGSTDGTLDIIKKYEDKIDYWVSEPDEGISDAFNKGITAATGKFIGIINSDDWLSVDQIEIGVNSLLQSSADFVYGDLLFHGDDDGIIYRINGDPHYSYVIHSKMPNLCHPTVLANRCSYERNGLFDKNLLCAMDYEWLLRLHVHGGNGIYVRNLLGHMRIAGKSDVSYLRALREVRDISISYGKSRFSANLLYFFRIAKGTIRRVLETNLPNIFYHRMRRMINSGYSKAK